MKNLEKIVEEEMFGVQKELSLITDVKSDIFDELKDFLNSPTKRIRTLVSALYIRALGGNPSVNILTIGELIHNASLLHDDVLDGSKTRRGELSFWKKFSPHVSILAGDWLLSIVTEKLIKENNWDVIKIFQNCIRKMSEAEFLQYSLRGKVPQIDEYIQIAEGKTAALFEAIIKSNALILGLDIHKAEEFGKNFGILFQLKNDLEKVSAEADKQNGIFTPKDILGIEKTNILIDNYLKKIQEEIRDLPVNKYSNGLKGLLGLL